MESSILSKIFENEIISNVKHKNLTPYEIAQLIDEYLKEQQVKGVKLEEIEAKLGVTKRVLYKYRSILKLPKDTIEKYKDDLSFEQMSVISYSVKDKSKIPEVLAKASKEKTSSKALVYEVAELNDKSKIQKHILSEIFRTGAWAEELKGRIKTLSTDEQRNVREAIDDLVNKLNEI